MNRNHLALFAAVAEAGGITAAAQRLAIGQPTVSRQIAALEASVGVPLLIRGGREGAQLTAAGEALAVHARRLAALERDAADAMRAFRGLDRGRLGVGASSTIAAWLLPEAIAGFAAAHPRIAVQLEVGNSAAIERLVRDGAIDLGFVEGGIDDTPEGAVPFFADRLAIITHGRDPLAQSSAVTADEVVTRPWILRERGSGTRRAFERSLAARGLSITPVMELGSTEAVKRTVAAGAGLGVVSLLAIQNELNTGELATVPLRGLDLHRVLHLLRPARARPDRAAQSLLALLERALARRGLVVRKAG